MLGMSIASANKRKDKRSEETVLGHVEIYPTAASL